MFVILATTVFKLPFRTPCSWNAWQITEPNVPHRTAPYIAGRSIVSGHSSGSSYPGIRALVSYPGTHAFACIQASGHTGGAWYPGKRILSPRSFFQLGIAGVTGGIHSAYGHGHWPWLLAMATCHGNWLGPLAMASCHWPWPLALATLAMATGPGHWPWPLAMATGHWPWPLATGHGRWPWPPAMATGHGHWPWPVTMATGHGHGHGHWPSGQLWPSGHSTQNALMDLRALAPRRLCIRALRCHPGPRWAIAAPTLSIAQAIEACRATSL